MSHKLRHFINSLDFEVIVLYVCLVIIAAVTCGLMVYPANAAVYSHSGSAIGDIAVIHNSDISYAVSNKDINNMPLARGQVYKEGSMGSQFVSGAGSAGYADETNVDSTNMQTIRSSSLAQATDGGVMWESASMSQARNPLPDAICDSAGNIAIGYNTTGQTPLSDSVTYYTYADGQAFTYTNDRAITQSSPDVVDDSAPDELDVSVDVKGVEGLYASAGSYITGSAKASGNKSAPAELNCDLFVNGHEFASGKDTALDFTDSVSWKSFGDAFGFDSPVNSSANETNQSEESVNNITNSS